MILYSNTAYYCSRHLFLHPCILLMSSIRSPEQKGKLRHKQDEASPRSWGPCCDSDWFSANSYRLFSLLLMPPLSPILTYTQLKQPYRWDNTYVPCTCTYVHGKTVLHTHTGTHTYTHACKHNGFMIPDKVAWIWWDITEMLTKFAHAFQ